MALQDKSPPDEEKDKTSSKTKTPRATRTAARKGSDLDKIRKRLTEFFDTLAAGQQMVGTAVGDPRPFIGGKVTEELSPTLVDAWVNLAEESPAVKRYLLAMAEGSAWGEVTFATIGFTYTMAQAYGAVPYNLVNPWMDLSDVIPPSPEVVNHAATNGTRTVPDMPTEQPSPAESDPTAGMSEAEIAQMEAERIAERRKNRKGPVVE